MLGWLSPYLIWDNGSAKIGAFKYDDSSIMSVKSKPIGSLPHTMSGKLESGISISGSTTIEEENGFVDSIFIFFLILSNEY